jgi:ABC-type nitrate/sulfonate/bicarbonate transport system substrate-binding protein
MKVRLAILGIAAIVAAACGAGGPGATATPLTRVTAAYSNITGDDWVMWYAFEKGVFRTHGLDVDVKDINGGAQTSAALLANQIQIGQFGGSEALSAAAGGADVVVVANMAPVYPYILYSRKEIKTLADLKGKKIGVSNPGGSSDIATRAALKTQGIDPDKDVTIVGVGSHSARTAALLSGAIDAGVDDPPEDDALVKAGLNPLIDIAGLKLPAANTGIVVQRSYVASGRATLQAYVDATVDARSKMQKDKEGSIAVLQKYFKKIDAAAAEHAYTFFIGGTDPVTPVYPFPGVLQFKDSIAVLGAKNAKIKTVDLAKLVDTSFVKSAQDRKVGG